MTERVIEPKPGQLWHMPHHEHMTLIGARFVLLIKCVHPRITLYDGETWLGWCIWDDGKGDLLEFFQSALQIHGYQLLDDA